MATTKQAPSPKQTDKTEKKGAAVKAAAPFTQDQLLNLVNELTERCYKPGFIPGTEQVILTIKDNVIGTLENFVVFAGIPKAGKSTFLTALAASSFMQQDIFGIRVKFTAEKKSFALFDTEQSTHDFYKMIERVKKLAGTEKVASNFFAFQVRGEEPDKIQQLIEAFLVTNPDTCVIVVDGLLDLLNNYNDETECKKLINWIKRITKQYNFLFVTVVHNSKNSGNTVGHIGSMADRYAQSVLEVTKQTDADSGKITYNLAPKFLRSSADFSPIVLFRDGDTFQIEETQPNNWKQIGEAPRKGKLTLMQHQQELEMVFKQAKELEYKNLVNEIIQAYAVGTTKAKGLIVELKTKNLLTRDEKGFYKRP